MKLSNLQLPIISCPSLWVMIILCCLSTNISASTQTTLTQDESSLCERICACVTPKGSREPMRLYQDKENPWIQELNLSFRAQYQGAVVKANQGSYPGSHDSTSEWRRLRLGWNAKLFNAIKLVNTWNLGGVYGAGYPVNGLWHDHKQTTGNLFEMFVEYAWDGNKISIGKMRPMMLCEYRQGSSSYIMPELPALEEQLKSENAYGIAFSRSEKDKSWDYYGGVWSDTERSYRKAWGTWYSAFTTMGVSKKADDFILSKGRLYFDWIYNFLEMDGFATQKFDHRDSFVGSRAEHTFALYYKGSSGPFELNVEIIEACHLASYKQKKDIVTPDNALGLIFTPMYMLTDHLQVVFRYQCTTGDDAVALAKRYVNLVPTEGSYINDYQAIALGFNFYVYPENHKRMKIMLMAEYTNSHRNDLTKGMTGWTYIGGMYLDF